MGRARRVWIDVGANRGQYTFAQAEADSSLLVFAFEPNWALARELMGKLENFVVLPMAVADSDGFSEFNVNVAAETSSLLSFNADALERGDWKGVAGLAVQSVETVPTIRLDTFLDRMGIKSVEYLKIDTQGLDFQVVQSAGARLKDIEKVMLEVDVSSTRCYAGSAAKEEVVSWMASHGFSLVSAVAQTYGREENLTFVRAGGISGPSDNHKTS